MPNFVDGIGDRMIIRDGLFGLASLGRLMNSSLHILSDMSNFSQLHCPYTITW